MLKTKLPRFKELYTAFRQTESYANRVKQLAIAPVNRDIIIATLSNEPIKNEHLTGLIQMFKHGVTDETFDYYLEQNVSDNDQRSELSDRAYKVNEYGYTGAGLNSIADLSDEQLSVVKAFLLDAFDVTNIKQAQDLCKKFEAENVPLVKSGIYSPWLYYIQPSIFPILNNSHDKFRQWLDIPKDYAVCIEAFSELRRKVNEVDLGLLDIFAHNFKTDSVKRDIAAYQKLLRAKFKNIWRVASSLKWQFFTEQNVLSIDWLAPDINFRKTDLRKKIGLNRWVNRLREGNLIVVMDKHNYYGLAIALTKYEFKTNDKNLGGQIRPCIDVLFIHKLDTPAPHKFKISSPQPASFYDLEGIGFSEYQTFSFIESNYPEAFDKLDDYLNNIEQQKEIMENTSRLSMNSILYGPPGTGKTFHSISHAVAIIEGKNIDDVVKERENKTALTEAISVKDRYDKYVEDGLIKFCTFHQSMSYEDFIEGIKPLKPDENDSFLKYNIQDGIFKRICVDASFSFVAANQASEAERLLDFSEKYDLLADYIVGLDKPLQLTSRSGGEVEAFDVSNQNNILIRHIDGTKEYTVSKERLSRIAEAYPKLDGINSIRKQFKSIIGGCNYTAYYSVLKAIYEGGEWQNVSKDEIDGVTSDYAYEDKRAAMRSLKKEDYRKANSHRYVLIIDEINRGNVSQVFGELITLIEDDKRFGKEEALTVTLPYSGDDFGVPPNLYIIGTMNTADRSVEALDTALRRRFTFVPMLPEETKLIPTSDGIDLPKMLKTLNSRLKILKDADHTIGHAWLMNVTDADSLSKAFANKILPLLQEYFYNDYEKLGMLLGEKFFKKPTTVDDKSLAKFFGSSLSSQYENAEQYQLEDVDKLTKDVFVSIYQ